MQNVNKHPGVRRAKVYIPMHKTYKIVGIDLYIRHAKVGKSVFIDPIIFPYYLG